MPPTCVSIVGVPLQTVVVPEILEGWVEPVLIVITTSSVEGKQGAFEIVQRRVYVFPATPVKAEVGLEAVAIEPPAPEMMLHAPVPLVGVLAAKFVVVAQTAWSGPALAIVVAGVTVMVPVAVEVQPAKLVTVAV